MRVIAGPLSHLGIWPALYVVAAVVCAAELSGVPLRDATTHAVLAFAFLTAVAAYLLDRVKLRDAWLDPADLEAHPARFTFLARRTGALRIAIAAAVAGAALVGATVSRWLSAVPILACVGVLVYAAMPRGRTPRVKDTLVLKNAYVSGGIATFAVLTAVVTGGVEAGRGSRAITAAFAFGYVGIRVFADAALCDLDDEHADRTYGTRTLPTRFGRQTAWNIALALRAGSAVGLAFVPVGPAPARLAWALTTVGSSASLRLVAPAYVRDWVDLRFAVDALLATTLQVLWRILTTG